MHVLRLLNKVELPLIPARVAFIFANESNVSQLDQQLVNVQQHSPENLYRLHDYDGVLLVRLCLFNLQQIFSVGLVPYHVHYLLFNFLNRIFIFDSHQFIGDRGRTLLHDIADLVLNIAEDSQFTGLDTFKQLLTHFSCLLISRLSYLTQLIALKF